MWGKDGIGYFMSAAACGRDGDQWSQRDLVDSEAKPSFSPTRDANPRGARDVQTEV